MRPEGEKIVRTLSLGDRQKRGTRVHERLARLFEGLRPRSEVSLKQALEIRDTSGVPATLIIQIPADPAKPTEVFLTTAPVKIVHDLHS